MRQRLALIASLCLKLQRAPPTNGPRRLISQDNVTLVVPVCNMTFDLVFVERLWSASTSFPL